MNNFLLTMLLMLLVFSSDLLALDHFKSYIEYANKWIVITATEKVGGICKSGKELNTNFFTGLKGGLHVCVAAAYDNKDKAVSALKTAPKGSAYLKYTGGFNETLNIDSASSESNLLFTISLSDSVFLQCFKTTKQPDSIQLQSGNTSSYNLYFKSYKNKKNVQSASIDVISYSLKSPDFSIVIC